MMYNKRAWIRILEATIGVMIVSSVLIVVYSNQETDRVTSEEYIFNLQKKILTDIYSRDDLRKAVLDGSPDNISYIENYTNDRIPTSFSHSIRVCKLGNQTDFCNLNETIFLDTVGKDIYAEEIVISSDFEIGYNPKKVKLFIWDAG